MEPYVLLQTASTVETVQTIVEMLAILRLFVFCNLVQLAQSLK